jgi:cephalosporin hydroxylase
MQLISTDIDVEASYATLETEAGHKQWHAGLGVWKSVDDLNRHGTIIAATRPEVVIETGTRWGGYAAWVADTFGIDVITVDIERTAGRPSTWPRVSYVLGDSVKPAATREVRRLRAGRRTMVVLDSDHHAPHVEREIATYGPLVTPGCHLVVEDGLADLLEPDRAQIIGHRIPKLGGPLRAISTTLAGRPGWRRDLAIENLSPISHSPGGWWIRTDS